MKTPIAMLAAMFAAAACQLAAAAAPDRPADYGGFTFSRVLVASVARLQGGSEARGAFHNCRVVSRWLVLDPRWADPLADMLKKRLGEQVALLTGPGDRHSALVPLGFEPAYAVHLETDNGVCDFVICLRCAFIYAYDARGNEVAMQPDHEMLKGLKASYLDEFMLGEGILGKP